MNNDGTPNTGWFPVENPVVERLAKAGGTAALVYLILARHANKQGRCWPSVPTIARLLGLSDRVVQSALRRLQETGLVEKRLRQTDRGAQTSNEYTLLSVPPQEPGERNVTPRSHVHRGGEGIFTDEGEGIFTGGVKLRSPKQDPIEQEDPSEGRKPSDDGSPTVDDLVRTWNGIKGVRPCRKVTENRRRAFKTRAKDSGWLQDLPAALAKVKACKFCLGENDRGWKANIDWLLRPDTLTKILEGTYDDGNGQARVAGCVEAGSTRVFR